MGRCRARGGRGGGGLEMQAYEGRGPFAPSRLRAHHQKIPSGTSRSGRPTTPREGAGARSKEGTRCALWAERGVALHRQWTRGHLGLRAGEGPSMAWDVHHMWHGPPVCRVIGDAIVPPPPPRASCGPEDRPPNPNPNPRGTLVQKVQQSNLPWYFIAVVSSGTGIPPSGTRLHPPPPFTLELRTPSPPPPPPPTSGVAVPHVEIPSAANPQTVKRGGGLQTNQGELSKGAGGAFGRLTPFATATYLRRGGGEGTAHAESKSCTKTRGLPWTIRQISRVRRRAEGDSGQSRDKPVATRPQQWSTKQPQHGPTRAPCLSGPCSAAKQRGRGGSERASALQWHTVRT